MSNSFNQQPVTEINLKELFWKMLTQWKALLIVSLIMALLLCGTKHVKDVHAYNDELEAQKKAEKQATLSLDERMEKAMEMLPNDEAESVCYLLREQEWLNTQKEYLNDSILMNTDPTNQRVLKLVYDIEADNPNKIATLIDNYYLFLQSEEIIEAIKPYFSIGADNKYITELFYKEETDMSFPTAKETLTINLVLTEDTDAEDVRDAINDTLAKNTKKMQALYPHSLALVGEEETHVYHEENVNRRREIFGNINGLETSIDNTKNKLSTEQEAAFEALADYSLSADAIEDKPEVPGWSKKYAVFGFVVGAVIYAGIYVLLTIIKGGIGSAAGLRTLTGARLFGEIYYNNKEKTWRKLFYSNFINRIRYKGKNNTSEQINMIVDAICSVCEHLGSKSVTFFTTDDVEKNDQSVEIIEKILEKVLSNGVNASVIYASNNIEENHLLDTKNAVFVASEYTKASILSNVLSICADYDIKTLGCIYLSGN